MIFNSKFLLFYCLFGFLSYFSKSQKLFVPVEDNEIISIYTKGEKKDDGSYISRDSKGNIRIKGKFDKLTPVGKWYLFFDDGKLMSNYSYNEDGKLDGIFVEYFSNGNIKTSGKFEKNIRSGIWKTYYLNGNVETEGLLLEGKRYKQWVYYFEGGMIKEVSNYNYEGKLEGELISFDQFGTPVSKSFYKNNKINGQYLEFYYNGRVALSGHYDMGLKDSLWIEYSGFNKKSFEKRYKNDLPHSKWIYYYSSN